MSDLPEVLSKAAREVQGLLEQIQTINVKYASLETQLRIIQNDLWAAESELALLRKQQATQTPFYIRKEQ